MNKNTATVVAIAIVISLSMLGWYALVGYVVTTTGSTAGLVDIANATGDLIHRVLSVWTR